MADEKALGLLEVLLRKGGHAKAARYLSDEYVRSRLTLPKPGEPQVVKLPSGRSIGFKKSKGLGALADTIERLHHGSVIQNLPRLIADLQDEMHAVRLRFQGSPWLTVTNPYRRLHELLNHPREPETQTRILQSWLDYQTRHPGSATPQGWAPAVASGLGFTAGLYAALERLASFPLDGLLLEVLAVVHSPQPVVQYHTAPVCLLLQQTQVIPDSERVAAAGQVLAILERLLAIMVRFILEKGKGLDGLLDLVTAEGCIPGATPREVLHTFRQVGAAHNLRELSRAADERTRALALTPSPSPVRTHETTPDWPAMAEPLSRLEPGLPDEVMRSLLEAALQRAVLKRRYGLPAGEYWVACPDPILERAGIQRLTFTASASGLSIHCVTDPLPLRFSLGVPPAGVTRGALLLILMAAIMYEAMVTQRDSFTSQEARRQTTLRWTKVDHGGLQPVHRTVVARVPRPGARGAQAHGSTSTQGRASFVVPHLRKLRPGGRPGPEAPVHAAEHGIRLPDGYTFVRGHLRGAGPEGIAREFSVADIAMETISRLRRQQCVTTVAHFYLTKHTTV